MNSSRKLPTYQSSSKNFISLRLMCSNIPAPPAYGVYISFIQGFKEATESRVPID
jgi:hypothetical protein